MALSTAAAPEMGYLWSFSLLFLLAGLSALGYGVKEHLLIQKIKNTPTSKVRSAAVGLVEIKGKARAKDALTSPISKPRCEYWHVSAQYHHQDTPGRHWRTFYSDTSSGRFYIEDETGRMLVDPDGGTVSIKRDFLSQGTLSGKALFGLLDVKQLDRNVLDFLDLFMTHCTTACSV